MPDRYDDPAAALASVHEGRAQLLAAVTCPPSRHLAFAAVVGGYVAAPGLAHLWRVPVLLAIVVAIVLIVRWDKRRTGVFVSGLRSGRTRRVAGGLLVVVLPLYMLGLWLADMRGLHWPSLAMAPVAAAFGYWMSVVWMRVFRREMLGAA